MSKEKLILTVVIGGTMFTVSIVLLVITLIVIYQKRMMKTEKNHSLELKNKELDLMKAVVETEESERMKIASNIHDQVNPLLATLKLSFTSFIRKKKQVGETSTEFEKQRQLIDEIIDNIQSATKELSPNILYNYGLPGALFNYVSSLADIEVKFNNRLPLNFVLPETIQLNVYRIILEIIQNIIKHDNISCLTVGIDVNDNDLIIRLEHDGAGISNEEIQEFKKKKIGIGLNSIYSRLFFLRAELNFFKKPQSEIVLKVPLAG